MNEANTAWILVSTALVLLMTLPGLALFYAGLVGSKNTLSTLAQCFIIACIASIIWFVACLLYTSPSPRDVEESRMPSSA